MGLLGAISSGVGAGLEGVGKEMDRQSAFQQQMQMLSQKMTMESEQRRADKTWEMDESESRQQAQAQKITEKAGLLAGSRVTNTPEEQAEADGAAKAYSAALARGDISQEDAEKGYGAASDYLKRTEKQNTQVTPEDRKQAAIELGYISPKDAAVLDAKDSERDMKAAIAQGKWENALQIAQMKGDFAMVLGEMKASAAAGNEKATEMMRNWKFLSDKGWADDKIAQKLLEGKVGEYTTTETERENPDGSKTKTIRKSKPGEEPKSSGANFKWVNGKLVPQ